MERAISVTVDFGKREAWTAEERAQELAELAQQVDAHAHVPAQFLAHYVLVLEYSLP